jgi:hypothetical protein
MALNAAGAAIIVTAAGAETADVEDRISGTKAAIEVPCAFYW